MNLLIGKICDKNLFFQIILNDKLIKTARNARSGGCVLKILSEVLSKLGI